MPLDDNNWSRVVNTTIAKYFKGKEQEILRSRKWLALLNQKGRVFYNDSGKYMDWKVEYKRVPMIGWSGVEDITFAQHDRYKTCELDWRGYVAADAMTKFDRLKNAGPEAIINYWSEISENLRMDMEDHFGDELYIDGNAAGNSKRLHGIESFLGAGSNSTDQPIAFPSDTYAGLSTALGNYGGEWQEDTAVSTWPTGSGDAHYDFFSPLLISYTSAQWAATGTTWADTCLEAMRYGLIHAGKNRNMNGQIDLTLLDRELYRIFCEKEAEKERIVVNRGTATTGLVALGFTDTVNFQGADVTYEYGVPSGIGYGMNINNMELRSMQSQLFVPDGPDYDMAKKNWRFSIDFAGNLKFRPRHFFKLAAYG